MPLWWIRIREWLLYRRIRKLLYASVDTMLVLAERDFRRSLTTEEQIELMRLYGAWLNEHNDRLFGIVEHPVRTIQLFLTDTIR